MPGGFADDDSQNHELYFHRMEYGTDMIRGFLHNELKGIITSIQYTGLVYGLGVGHVDIRFGDITGPMADLFFGVFASMQQHTLATTTHNITRVEIIDVNNVRVHFNSAPAGAETVDLTLLIIGRIA